MCIKIVPFARPSIHFSEVEGCIRKYVIIQLNVWCMLFVCYYHFLEVKSALQIQVALCNEAWLFLFRPF